MKSAILEKANASVMKPLPAEPPSFCSINWSESAHHAVKTAWNEILPIIGKPGGKKQSDRELWILQLKNHFDSQFIALVEQKEKDPLNGKPFDRSKFLSTLYTNSNNQLTLILGYKVKFPDTFHLMFKLEPHENH